MEKLQIAAEKLSIMTGIPICFCESDQVFSVKMDSYGNPVLEQETFRKQMMVLAGRQEGAVIYKDCHQVFFCCLSIERAVLIAGPMILEPMERIVLRKFYQDYGMNKSEMIKMPRIVSLQKMISFVQILELIFNGTMTAEEELIRNSGLTDGIEYEEDQKKQEFILQEEEENRSHHTYLAEKKLLDSVREGRTEDALRYNTEIDSELGKLSRREIEHWRKMVVVSITLCVRAAIEGGISPAEAYQLSDYYIQQSDDCSSIPELFSCRQQAIQKLTESVKEKQQTRKTRSYVELCKVYVEKHYREKIYLEIVAEDIGISASYLSRMFRADTGKCFQDYVTEYRVKRAANLLRYSEESLAAIAEYVNFPSQSYFGKVFKKQMQMTPARYREMYKPVEFISKKSIEEKS